MGDRIKVSRTPIDGAYVLERLPFADERGSFSRLFCREELKECGFEGSLAQINHSHTKARGAVRGMHFQYPPHAEAKMVTCLRGSVFDVVVDLRHGSESFLRWYSETLSGDNMKTLFIPEGCAHGFQTLEDGCELIYFHSEFYHPRSEGGVRHDDPVLAIDWPLEVTEISDKDRRYPLLEADFQGIVLR